MGAVETVRYTSSSVAVRLAATVLGVWLLVSSFLWPHDSNEQFNAVVVGLSFLMFGPAAIWAPALRWLNTLAAGYLCLATVVFKHASTFNLFHHLALGGILFVLSCIHGTRPHDSQEELGEPRFSEDEVRI